MLFGVVVVVVVIVVVVVSSEGGAHRDSSIFPQGLRVNADANPPSIDTVANGGRPCVLQQDSPPSRIPLNIQDWMDGRELSSSCHTKLRLVS
ncbi:hypothetical protein ACTXT7_014006 [Hymenolepis weldensis]